MTTNSTRIILLCALVVALSACGGELAVDGEAQDAVRAGFKSCGNGVCNGHESCESCPADCGECAADSGPLAPPAPDGGAGSAPAPDSSAPPAEDAGGVVDEASAAGTALPVRPSVRGTMTRAYNASITTKFPFIDHQVVQVHWNELERSGSGTASGGYYAAGTGDWLTLEKALDSGAKVRLRVYAGRHAPAYVKRIGFGGVYSADCPDGGIYVFNPFDKVGGCSPKFWLPAVLARYEALMNEIAARFGARANLLEVVDSACMTTYAEPFYRAHRDKASNQRLIAAGLTWGKDLYCHQEAILIHERTFKQVRTTISVNPWDIMNPADSVDGVDMRWRETYDFLEGGGTAAYRMRADGTPSASPWPGARGVLKRRLTLQNNGLGEDEGCTLAGGDTLENAKKSHYCYLSYVARTTSHNVGFQSETMDRLRGRMCSVCSATCSACTYLRSEAEGVRMACDRALAMHAAFIELPSGFPAWTEAAAIQMLGDKDAALEANAP